MAKKKKKFSFEELREFKNGKYMGGPAEERAEKKKKGKRYAIGGPVEADPIAKGGPIGKPVGMVPPGRGPMERPVRDMSTGGDSSMSMAGRQRGRGGPPGAGGGYSGGPGTRPGRDPMERPGNRFGQMEDKPGMRLGQRPELAGLKDKIMSKVGPIRDQIEDKLGNLPGQLGQKIGGAMDMIKNRAPKLSTPLPPDGGQTMKKGGMVRGSGCAIRGVKKARM
jgi:hypothetical protein